ncbi:MAG TPA: hypothetical protein VF535_07750 [Allosphingosinicella sp.]
MATEKPFGRRGAGSATGFAIERQAAARIETRTLKQVQDGGRARGCRIEGHRMTSHQSFLIHIGDDL